MHPKNIFLFLTMCCVFAYGCSYADNNEKTKISMANTEETRDGDAGDVLSADRWNHIESNISKISEGMTKLQVIRTLGRPDNFDFIPSDVMQYSVAYGVVGQFQPKAIYIFLDENNRVTRIKRSKILYAPQPH